MSMYYRVVKKNRLAPGIFSIDIHAPLIARKAKPGQFVVLMTDERGERIPLTIADWDVSEGYVRLIFEVVGRTTRKLASIEEKQNIYSIAGPLGNPSEVGIYGRVAVIGGGVGIAACYPIARGLREAGNDVISILGARSGDFIILESEMNKLSEVIITTDDGSRGIKGFVTDALRDILKKVNLNRVWAVGPAPMMKAVSDITRGTGIKTIVSLNAIMVDGTGMCGSCRVTVGGKMKLTCVDGPEFDGHEVDWNEFIPRLQRFSEQESSAYHGGCGCGEPYERED
ncbi:MAG: sulfide/dihydroorotate dehydrogenase-like FAD/NAD-binding protein [Candidatus Hadarchaeales archaeon]